MGESETTSPHTGRGSNPDGYFETVAPTREAADMQAATTLLDLGRKDSSLVVPTRQAENLRDYPTSDLNSFITSNSWNRSATDREFPSGLDMASRSKPLDGGCSLGGATYVTVPFGDATSNRITSGYLSACFIGLCPWL